MNYNPTIFVKVQPEKIFSQAQHFSCVSFLYPCFFPLETITKIIILADDIIIEWLNKISNKQFTQLVTLVLGQFKIK